MNKNERSKSLRNLTVAAVCLAMCMALPFLTAQLPQIGNALLPMHIPVLLCGFICGPFYAAIVGFIAPALRFMLFGMPPLFPIGIAMCFELAVYGFVSGLLYEHFPKSAGYVYVSLIAAMVLGRVVWGVVRVALSGVANAAFTWEIFIAEAVLKAIPGIILQIVLIPVVVLALQKTKVLGNQKKIPSYNL